MITTVMGQYSQWVCESLLTQSLYVVSESLSKSEFLDVTIKTADFLS